VPNVRERVEAIRARIEAALARSPHENRPVTLIAVTKYHPAALVDEVVSAGVPDIGESRVQEAWAKAREVATPPRWHLVGRLQRNKASRAARLFSVIHSVDSLRLVDALARTERPLSVFVQVNVSGEESKGGVAPGGVRELLRACLDAPSLTPLGLMTMAPFSDDPENARRWFRELRERRDEWNERGDGPPLRALSMGMSGDFEVAVEEGATHIRIGTAITGERSPTGG